MRIETDSAVTSLALFGVDPDGQVAAGLPAVPAEDEVLLPGDIAADLEVASGDTVSVNGRDLTVIGTVPTDWYSHSPVGYVPLESFRAVAHQAEDTRSEERRGGSEGKSPGAWTWQHRTQH